MAPTGSSSDALKRTPPSPSAKAAGPGALAADRSWSADLLRSLNRDLGINIDRFIKDDEIRLVTDPENGLQHFVGCTSGDAEYYEELSALPFYYMDEKWEFSVAEEIVRRDPGATLEVGSGPGHFLARLKNHSIEHLGLEFNRAAVELCRAKGVNVVNQPLSELSASGRKFKFVCSFQVLEHVEDPVGLLREMLGVLDTGGLLVISVPDRESFISRFSEPVLDMPPHHMTRWSAESFERIAKSLNAHVVDVQREPLAAHHVGWYAESFFDRVPRAMKLRAIAVRLLSPFVHLARQLRPIPGHTLLVVIRRDLDA